MRTAALDEANLTAQAYFYAGTKRLIDGDTRTARQYFEQVVTSPDKTTQIFFSARAELKLFEKREKALARPDGDNRHRPTT